MYIDSTKSVFGINVQYIKGDWNSCLSGHSGKRNKHIDKFVVILDFQSLEKLNSGIVIRADDIGWYNYDTLLKLQGLIIQM